MPDTEQNILEEYQALREKKAENGFLTDEEREREWQLIIELKKARERYNNQYGEAQRKLDEDYEKMIDERIAKYEALPDEQKARSGYKANSYSPMTEEEMSKFILEYAKDNGVEFKDMDELMTTFREAPSNIWQQHHTDSNHRAKVASNALRDFLHTDASNEQRATQEYRSQFAPIRPKIENITVSVPGVDHENGYIFRETPKLEIKTPTQTTPNSNLTRNKYDEGSKMPAIETNSKYENKQ